MKKILIVFTQPHLAYSPSVLNLYDELSNAFDVTILTFEPYSSYSSEKVMNRKVIYLQHPPTQELSIFRKVLKELTKKIKLKNKDFLLLRGGALPLIKKIKKFDGDIIAVDFFALWCVKMSNKRAHLFSLEISDNDFMASCSINDIKSVIIQSEERYSYLFGNQKIEKFIIQNAPRYIDELINVENRKKNDLLFCGSAVPNFGIFHCLEFLSDFPEYRLTIKGAVPTKVQNLIENDFIDLVEEKRLIISKEYLLPSVLNTFLGRFRVGFVFYDYFRFDEINTINYKTAPSGKLFEYYNAGIPVIANDIPGLYSIKEFRTGVIIKTMGSVAIKSALDTIERDYENYAKRSKELSAYFDFNKSVVKFVNYIRELNYR